MSRKDIIGYTGVDTPPFCEMTLRAVPSKTTPPDLQFIVILDGFVTPNNMLQLTRKAEIVTDVPMEGNAKDGLLCNLLCFFIVIIIIMPRCACAEGIR